MVLRKAITADIEALMPVFAQARRAQRLAGFRQWEDGYPSEDVLKSDVESSVGFVLDDGGAVAGYVAIATDDSEYNRHPELWDTTRSYAVFHRIALGDAYRGRNLSAVLFGLAESYAKALGISLIRIDTGLENKPMQRVLAKRGYTCLGRCDFIWGPRLAYEKAL